MQSFFTHVADRDGDDVLSGHAITQLQLSCAASFDWWLTFGHKADMLQYAAVHSSCSS